MKRQFWYGVLAGAIVTALVGSTFLYGAFAWNGFGVVPWMEKAVSRQKDAEEDGEWATSNEEVDKVNLIKAYIDKYYLDEVDREAASEGMYKGLLGGLGDPYSVYFTEEEYKAMLEATSGEYYGVGAIVSQDVKTGSVTIVKPFVDGPAYLAGILPGDVIMKVNGEDVAGKDLTEVVSKLKGEEGTFVEVEVARQEERDLLQFSLERRQIEVPTVEHEMLEDGVGYVSVMQFDEVTTKQFTDALDDLDGQGMKGLVIDLRNNGGGSLGTVVEMLDRMLPEGMIVYTTDREGVNHEYASSAEESFDKPLAVLINENSASASEVFAGAIQDYETGVLVGTTSFGKGIVQSLMELEELNDGSAIKLTTSKYFTPKGRNIHGTGIEPDVEVPLAEGLEKMVVIEKKDDNQLQEALNVVKGNINKR